MIRRIGVILRREKGEMPLQYIFLPNNNCQQRMCVFGVTVAKRDACISIKKWFKRIFPIT